MPSLLLALVLTPVFALSGVRRGVLRRNAALLATGSREAWKGRPPSSFFRWRLGFGLFRDLGTLLFGRLPSPRLSPRSQAHLEALRSGPTVLLAAHFHNWEAQASALARLGVPLLGSARPLASPRAERMLRILRARHGIPVVSEGVPRHALRHLRAGGCFGFLWDQHAPASPRQGVFFGHPVTLNPLPIALLERVPCPVYFGALLPGGELRLVPLLRRFSGDWPARLERRYHRVLERLVRRHPASWYGFLHARFKNLGAYPGHREGAKYPVQSTR